MLAQSFSRCSSSPAPIYLYAAAEVVVGASFGPITQHAREARVAAPRSLDIRTGPVQNL